MADFTWTDVLQDGTRFPDAMQIDMGDGRGIVSLGDLRGTVNRALGESNRQRDVYAAEKQALEERLAYALAHPQVDPNTPPSPVPPAIDYSADPVLRPLHQAAQEARTMAQQNHEQMANMMKLQQQLMANIAQIPVVMRMEQLKAADPGLDPAKLTEFIQQKRAQPGDVADYYKLMTYEAQLAKARQEGIAAGKEEAVKEFQAQPHVPYMPYGPPQTVQAAQPQFGSMDDAEAAVLQDADILREFYNTGAA